MAASYPQNLPIGALNTLLSIVKGQSINKSDAIHAAYEILGYGLFVAFGQELAGSSLVSVPKPEVPKDQAERDLQKLISLEPDSLAGSQQAGQPAIPAWLIKFVLQLIQNQ